MPLWLCYELHAHLRANHSTQEERLLQHRLEGGGQDQCYQNRGRQTAPVTKFIYI